MTSRSDCEMPGPPLRGILSPPLTSLSREDSVSMPGDGIDAAFQEGDAHHVDDLMEHR